MWTSLRHRYTLCFKNIFSPLFFFCENKLSPLVSAVFIAVAIVFGTNIAFFLSVTFIVPVYFVFLKHFLWLYGVLHSYLGFFLVHIWGFQKNVSGSTG